MNRVALEQQIERKKSVLCVGLDPDYDKFPEGIPHSIEGLILFCKSIIEATAPYCVAYKPNLAFFECYGAEGLRAFEEVCKAVPKTHFLIADAKRGDIGNTSARYAKAFYETFGCDAITVAPYMGEDSVKPFVKDDKWVIVLGLTSNPGSKDFEQQKFEGGQLLWETVLLKCQEWASDEQMMFVTGATKADSFKRIRALAPTSFLLVPGIGAQGGDLEGVLENGLINGGGLLINSSRGILYKSKGTDFAEAAAEEAQRLQTIMASYL